MKKWFLLLALVLTVALQAQVEIYGSVRYGFFYENQNKQWTGNVKRFEANQKLFATSHLGTYFKKENITGKVEIGLSEANKVYLRQVYGEIDLGGMYFLIGQTFTGFGWTGVSAQVSPVVVGYENGLIGYGAFYDGRHPMIRLRSENGFYVSFMKPVKMDPAGLNVNDGDNYVDATIPRVNLGMNFKSDNLTFHPTLGFAFSNYNKDLAGTDESVMAIVAAMSMTFKADALTAKAQIGGGQNIADYGLGTSTSAKAFWNEEKGEVENVSTIGGFAELCYKVNQKAKVTTGIGYVSSSHDDYVKADQSMSAFVSLIHQLQSNFYLIHEVGFVDKMKDKNDNIEGSDYYIGWKLQLDLK